MVTVVVASPMPLMNYTAVRVKQWKKEVSSWAPLLDYGRAGVHGGLITHVVLGWQYEMRCPVVTLLSMCEAVMIPAESET